MISKLITKVGRYLAVASLIFLPVLVPAGVHAANPDLEGSLCGSANDLQISASGRGNCNTIGGGATTKVNNAIALVVNIFSGLVAVVSVIMIIYGGFRYITSGGDSGKISNAKNTIIYALIGLVVVALAQFIVQFVLTKVTGSFSAT